MKKILFISCVNVGYVILKSIINWPKTHLEVMTLTEKQASEWNVSGYYDFSSLCKTHHINCHYPNAFSLKDYEDLKFFRKNRFDLLIVAGWQRLIPDSILNTLTVGAIGIHGSSKKLPKGRGRSPINWSIIEGSRKYFVHVFLMDPGVDSGPVLGIYEFEITPFDTCDSLYKKVTIASKRIILNTLDEILNGTATFTKQKGKPTFYPKRTPEDGRLNFKQPTELVYNFIRAITKPYPGAFCYLGEEKIFIWKAIPFGRGIDYPKFKPGTICEVFQDRTFLVKTDDGTLLVLNYEPDGINIQPGFQLK